jgi:hypothetical protein
MMPSCLILSERTGSEESSPGAQGRWRRSDDMWELLLVDLGVRKSDRASVHG